MWFVFDFYFDSYSDLCIYIVKFILYDFKIYVTLSVKIALKCIYLSYVNYYCDKLLFHSFCVFLSFPFLFCLYLCVYFYVCYIVTVIEISILQEISNSLFKCILIHLVICISFLIFDCSLSKNIVFEI